MEIDKAEESLETQGQPQTGAARKMANNENSNKARTKSNEHQQ